MSETALQPIPQTVPEKLSQQFLSTTPQIVHMLPRDVSLDQFQAGLWMEFTTTPKLQECTPMSFIKATLKAAMAGHVPGRDCFMLPFKNKKTSQYEVTMVEYYQGIVRALDRTGRVEWAKAEPVYAEDHFICDELAERYEFQRHIDGDRGKLRCYFSAVKLKGAAKPLVRVCTIEEVDKVRLAAPGKEQDPWQKWPEEMGKKTALKKHAKYLQLVPEEEEPIPAVNHSALLFGGDEAEQSRLRATRPSVAAILTAPEPEDAGRMAVPEYANTETLGETTVKLYEDRDQGPLVATPPIKSVEQIREEAGALVKAAAATCGATSGDIWDNVKNFAPKKFQLQCQQDLDTVESLLPNAIKSWVKAQQPEPEPGQPVPVPEDTSWMPEAELLAWIDAEAKKRRVNPDVLKSILTEYSEGWEGTLATFPEGDIPEWKKWAEKLWKEDAGEG